MDSFLGKQVLVIGLGLSGRSAVRFLQAHQAIVHGVDRNPHLLAAHPEIQELKQKGLAVHLEERCGEISRFDLIVLSPGVPTTHP